MRPFRTLQTVALRMPSILVLAFVTLAVNSLGLNHGIVLCVDDDGSFALEMAHVRHAHLHAEGADHHPDEFPVDSDHGTLHAALETCADASVAKFEHRSAGPSVLRLADATPLPAFVAPPPTPLQLLAHGRSGASGFCATTARAELAGLSAVILLV
jgi:hypothetical protein